MAILARAGVLHIVNVGVIDVNIIWPSLFTLWTLVRVCRSGAHRLFHLSHSLAPNLGVVLLRIVTTLHQLTEWRQIRSSTKGRKSDLVVRRLPVRIMVPGRLWQRRAGVVGTQRRTPCSKIILIAVQICIDTARLS